MHYANFLQSCQILCNPMDCSLPGSSVYGILQAKILELLCENSISLNYVELVHSSCQVYYILLLCIFFLLTFETVLLKLQLKILIYPLKNNCNI